MNQAVQKVREFIIRHRMFEGAHGAVVAVSGGPDSIALLDIMVQILSLDCQNSKEPVVSGPDTDQVKPRRFAIPEDLRSGVDPVQPNFTQAGEHATFELCIGHLDHMLRSDSAGDARFVAEVAGRHGMTAMIESADVRSESISSGRGIEEAAREARYRFLLRSARTFGANRIITGHTMDDQAETLIMRLVRGSGSTGLAGMKSVITAHEFEGLHGRDSDSLVEGRQSAVLPAADDPVLLIRPLLCLTRDEIERYCRDRGLEFRTDSSNASLDVTRNLIRHSVMPVFRRMNPRAAEAISRAAEIISSEDEAIDRYAELALGRANIEPSELYREPDIPAYRIHEFIEQPLAIRRRMIVQAVQERQAGIQITSAHVSALESLLTEQESGRRITLPANIHVWREFDVIRFRSAINRAFYELYLDPDSKTAEVEGFILTVERGVPSQLLSPIVEQARVVRTMTGQNWMTAVLDDEKLPKQMRIRPRRPGERATVLGHTGAMKLKSLMIDYRIPVGRRSMWPVVVSVDGCYIWSPFLPPSSDLSANENAKALAVLRARAGNL
jgi:tRNA(Ile)-lysidine synthase